VCLGGLYSFKIYKKKKMQMFITAGPMICVYNSPENLTFQNVPICSPPLHAFELEGMEIGNASMRTHGGVQAAGIAALQSWNDLASLKDVRAAVHSGALADLTALGAQAG